MNFKEIEGDLILLAKKGAFDVIAHGVNCWHRQKSGIALEMSAEFGTHTFPLELTGRGDINKLGQIDYMCSSLDGKTKSGYFTEETPLAVVNCYTQYKIAKFNDQDYEYTTNGFPFSYEAFQLCLLKMNHLFHGKKIGLPLIGCGKAKASPNIVRRLITGSLQDCDVTLVIKM